MTAKITYVTVQDPTMRATQTTTQQKKIIVQKQQITT